MQYRNYQEHPRHACTGIGATLLANLCIACAAFIALWYWLPESPRIKAIRVGELESAQMSLWKQVDQERMERRNADAHIGRRIQSLNADAVTYGSPVTTVSAPGDQLIIVRPPQPKE